MNIKETFLNLTKSTYPYGYEDDLIPFLPDGFKKDIDDNYYYQIGDDVDTVFTCHLDTACRQQEPVTHTFEGDYIKTDGKTILGADDKAGVTILLYMISHNVPGLYYFFIGEEVGCIGSGSAAKRKKDFSMYNKMVSFDRRSTTSIITYQSSKRCCSDAFADSLSVEFSKFGLNLEKDDTGVYTDSAEFVGIIPECTNISVGYYNEHTNQEKQDIKFLAKLANACVLINWNGLVVERDPSKTEYKKSDYWDRYTDYFPRDRKKWSREDEYDRNTWHRELYEEDVYDNMSGFDLYNDNRSSGKKKKKKENWSKKNGNVYFDGFSEEFTNFHEDDTHKEYDESVLKNYYEGYKTYFCSDMISEEELIIIRDQFLNMEDKEDSDFYNYMRSVL